MNSSMIRRRWRKGVVVLGVVADQEGAPTKDSVLVWACGNCGTLNKAYGSTVTVVIRESGGAM